MFIIMSLFSAQGTVENYVRHKWLFFLLVYDFKYKNILLLQNKDQHLLS